MKLAAVVLAVMSLVIVSVGAQSPNVVQDAHRTTHRMSMRTIVEHGSCSATAIAPHALLTASHCEKPNNIIEVDGKPVEIQGLTRDNFDHTILMVGATFPNFAELAAKEAKVGDDVFLFGNPGEMTDVYRRGYVAKEAPKELNFFAVMFGHPSDLGTYYDFNGFFGDSGAGIFNKDGQIVGVVSMIITQGEMSAEMKMMGGFPLHFTADQITSAEKFVPQISKYYDPNAKPDTDDDDDQ